MANPNLLAATTASGTTTYLTPGGTSAVVLLPNAASSGQVFKINQIAPAAIASPGVIVRTWSSRPCSASGRTPGVIIIGSPPTALRIAAVSNGEQTIALARDSTAILARATALSSAGFA